MEGHRAEPAQQQAAAGGAHRSSTHSPAPPAWANAPPELPALLLLLLLPPPPPLLLWVGPLLLRTSSRGYWPAQDSQTECSQKAGRGAGHTGQLQSALPSLPVHQAKRCCTEQARLIECKSGAAAAAATHLPPAPAGALPPGCAPAPECGCRGHRPPAAGRRCRCGCGWGHGPR